MFCILYLKRFENFPMELSVLMTVLGESMRLSRLSMQKYAP